MKFEELKNNLKKNIAVGYWLEGSDEYLISTSYELILKYANIEFQDLNVIKFSEGVIDCVDVVRALETMPVFSAKKIVHLDIRMSRKSEMKNIKVLNEYLENPNIMAVLVVSIGSNDEDFGVDKKLLEYVDCNKLDIKFVEAKIQSIFVKNNKTIDSKAMNLLIEYCLSDLSKIIIECEKLVAYAGDRKSITSDDIKEIVTRSIEYQIFELTDALAKKNSSKVYSIVGDLRAKKDEYKMLPSLIYSHFRRLFHISLNQGISNAEIARMLGVKEYAVKMSQGQVKLFSKSALKKINELCTSIDYDLKQSNISMDNAIELMIITILNI